MSGDTAVTFGRVFEKEVNELVIKYLRSGHDLIDSVYFAASETLANYEDVAQRRAS
jgi:hypothetical protein